ncbi:alpha/beta fold hydrolase [Vineibacter terrae]|uniref:alpha/beta fold hydrolase n=1 Tax=Vineibacter terrae TaxID=2586908 RepID=UPI002E326A8D|nr:alpha/beta fold hydrolase [Vineibacter terrae]HEX2885772.1 alpha/beta fold hydrolase [Vineibacter terrae]
MHAFNGRLYDANDNVRMSRCRERARTQRVSLVPCGEHRRASISSLSGEVRGVGSSGVRPDNRTAGKVSMMLGIRLLGEMEVLRGAERVELPRSKKTRALLAYLATTGRAHRRERLCELLWDVPDDPRGALRWSLSRIRALTQDGETPLIHADRSVIQFNVSSATVDLVSLRDGLDNIETTPIDRLKDAAAAFRGVFLEGLELPEYHEFRSWYVAEREDARALHVRILSALVERMSGEAAMPYARILVQIDPQDEQAWSRLVRLLAQAGRQQEAREQYETANRALRPVGGPKGPLLQAWREAGMASPAPRLTEPPGSEPAPAAPPAAPTRPPARQEIRFCIADDGVRIAYATAGQGTPLVKPANWMTHLEYDWESPVWQHWIRELVRNHRLVRYDERANGLSDWDAPNLTFDTFVRDLEAVVDAAGLERFDMLGVSQGCAIAIAYAVKHPQRVNRLVLYGGYTQGWALRAPEEAARRRALGVLMELGWGQDNPAFRQVFTSLFIPDGSNEQIQWFNDLQRMTISPRNAVRLNEVFGGIDIRPLMAQVRAPTLVLHCRDDNVAPFAEGRLMATTIPGARFVPLESRNHILLEGEPAWQRFVTEMRAFLHDEPT